MPCACGSETAVPFHCGAEVPSFARTGPVIVAGAIAALLVLALITRLGVFALERAHPPQGRMVHVEGGSLHVVDIGPRTPAPPIVLLHGASSNLEVMRRPLGELLARNHRVILIDRPGHG